MSYFLPQCRFFFQCLDLRRIMTGELNLKKRRKADPGLSLAASWIIQSFPARHCHPLTETIMMMMKYDTSAFCKYCKVWQGRLIYWRVYESISWRFNGEGGFERKWQIWIGVLEDIIPDEEEIKMGQRWCADGRHNGLYWFPLALVYQSNSFPEHSSHQKPRTWLRMSDWKLLRGFSVYQETGFVKSDTWISLSCYMDLWKLPHGLLKVVS